MSERHPDPLFCDPADREVHPPRHRLDRFLLADLDTAVQRQVEQHLVDCERCQRRLASMQAMHQAAPAPSPASLFQPGRPGTQTPAWVGWSVSLAAAMAIVFIVWSLMPGARTPLPSPPPTDPLISIKGAPLLQVHLRSGGVTRRYDGVQRLRGGDRLKFSVQPAGFSHLLILSVDSAGAVQAYFPLNGSASARLAHSLQKHALPGALQLDDSRRNERLLAIFSNQALTVATLRARIAARWSQQPALDKLTISVPNAVVISHWVIKR